MAGWEQVLHPPEGNLAHGHHHQLRGGFAPWGTSCHFHEGSLGVSLAEMVRVEKFSPEVVGVIKKTHLVSLRLHSMFTTQATEHKI